MLGTGRTEMRIDYASHDGPYKRRKAQGAAGWD
ncbi:unnamed protein product, partial [marine sediment metagenome]